MSAFDSADLLSRCKTLAQRPTIDAAMSDAQWYSLLTETQAQWTNVIAAQAPWVLMGAPTLLTSTDGGETYPFVDASSNAVFPLAVELYDTKAGRLMKNGAYWDASADYVWEGSHIRFPQGISQSFGDGPYARYVSPPGAVSGSVEPTLQPPQARLLMVYRAVAEWANRGGMRDPAPFYDLERRYWLGDMRTGDVGLLGALKMTNPFLGAAAYGGGTGGLLTGVDTGSWYPVP